MENTNIFVYGNNAQIIAAKDANGTACVAASVDYGCIYIGHTNAVKLKELLIRAVNNRTRERNYFKKYVELLEGDISDEQFESEIMGNIDDYVVPAGVDCDEEDVKIALELSSRIKGIETTDDFTSLFSISDRMVESNLQIAYSIEPQKLISAK